MTEVSPSLPDAHHDHMSWVRTRMSLDTDLMEWIRHGFALITVGFGSFAFLEGVAGVVGKGEGPGIDSPSRIFSLVATAIGTFVIAVALRHNRRMVAFSNEDAFGESPVPALPDEAREEYLAAGAIVIGVVSFVAQLFIR